MNKLEKAYKANDKSEIAIDLKFKIFTKNDVLFVPENGESHGKYYRDTPRKREQLIKENNTTKWN